MSRRIVLVPGTLALLPRYASLVDPVADLRVACAEAVAWLADGSAPVSVLADAQGVAVAQHLLETVAPSSTRTSHWSSARGEERAPGVSRPPNPTTDNLLVVGNGSARRTTSSPGPFDPDAVGFDADLLTALTAPDPQRLSRLDPGLCDRLWARVGGIPALGSHLAGDETVTVDYDDAPYGVAWWVLRWQG